MSCHSRSYLRPQADLLTRASQAPGTRCKFQAEGSSPFVRALGANAGTRQNQQGVAATPGFILSTMDETWPINMRHV